MKKYIAVLGILLMSVSIASAKKFRILQEFQSQSTATFGLEGGTDTRIEFENSGSTSNLTFTATIAETDFTVNLPTAPSLGSTPQLMAIDPLTGQWYFTGNADAVSNASTFTLTQIQDFTLGSIETSTHTNINVNYDPSGQLNIELQKDIDVFSITITTHASLNESVALSFDDDEGADTYMIKNAATDEFSFFLDGMEIYRIEPD